MGISFTYQQPVTHLLIADLKNTIPMVTVGTVAAIVVGVATGVLSAWRRGTVAGSPQHERGDLLLRVPDPVARPDAADHLRRVPARRRHERPLPVRRRAVLAAPDRHRQAHDPARRDPHADRLRQLHAGGPVLHAGDARRGLRAHRPGQGAARPPDRPAARVPQRAAPDGHPGRAGPRLHRRRRAADRGDLQLARHRAGHVRRDRAARLPDAAGRLPDPDRGRDHPELLRRPALLPPGPEDLRSDPAPTGPALAVEAEGQPSTRGGFFRTVLRERKAAVVGLSIIVLLRPAVDRGAVHLAVQHHPADLRGVRAAVQRALARLRRRRHRHAQPADAGRPDLPGGRVRRHPGRHDHRRRGRASCPGTSAAGSTSG